MSELSRAEFEERLLDLVSNSPDMRKKLLSDPKPEIERLLSIELPEPMTLSMFVLGIAALLFRRSQATQPKRA